MKNSVFPSLRPGINSVTIQELINQRNISSLRELGKSIKKKVADHDPEFNTTETLKVGGFNAEIVIEAIKLMIKYSEYNEWKKNASVRKAEIKEELDKQKSPAERKLELEKEYAEQFIKEWEKYTRERGQYIGNFRYTGYLTTKGRFLHIFIKEKTKQNIYPIENDTITLIVKYIHPF